MKLQIATLLFIATARTQYRQDVRSRKTTIMNGTGTVHGGFRDLPREYCYVSAEKI